MHEICTVSFNLSRLLLVLIHLNDFISINIILHIFNAFSAFYHDEDEDEGSVWYENTAEPSASVRLHWPVTSTSTHRNNESNDFKDHLNTFYTRTQQQNHRIISLVLHMSNPDFELLWFLILTLANPATFCIEILCVPLTAMITAPSKGNWVQVLNLSVHTFQAQTYRLCT